MPFPVLDFHGSLVDSIQGVKLNFARASTATYFGSDGLLKTAAIDEPRFDYDPLTGELLGLLREESRTNVALHNRDLTNAAWVKTNVTAAKDQTGIDGAANSASSITATAANGTVLQSITLASSARFQTAYVKRLAGSGTIEMTMDGGATWTPVTVTADWARVAIPTQTIASPNVGFRIATSGDAVAVDFVQNENGTFATSVTPTTTAAATRAADLCTLAVGSWFNPDEGTIVVEFETAVPAAAGLAPAIWSLDDASLNNQIRQAVNSGVLRSSIYNGSFQMDVSNGAITTGVVARSALAYKLDDCAAALNGSLVGTDNTVTLPTGISQLRVGDAAYANGKINGHIRRLRLFNKRISNADLQQETLGNYSVFSISSVGKLLLRGYAEEPEGAVLRTQMESGAKQAPIRSRELVQIPVVIDYSNEEYAAFKLWRRATLARGANFFFWRDPHDGVEKLARIVEGKYRGAPYARSPGDEIRWEVSMVIETWE